MGVMILSAQAMAQGGTERIKEAQQELRRLGCYGGEIDGVVGMSTRSALDRAAISMADASVSLLSEQGLRALRERKGVLCSPDPLTALARGKYLQEVQRKVQGYRYQVHVPVATEVTTVVQLVIARDGRLLDAQVVRSSGVVEMDRGVLAGVRAGSPYASLPSSIPGDQATFTLPIVSAPQAR